MARRLRISDAERRLIDRVVAFNRAESAKYFDRLQSYFPPEIQTETTIRVSDKSVTTALQGLADQESVDLILLAVWNALAIRQEVV